MRVEWRSEKERGNDSTSTKKSERSRLGMENEGKNPRSRSKKTRQNGKKVKCGSSHVDDTRTNETSEKRIPETRSGDSGEDWIDGEGRKGNPAKKNEGETGKKARSGKKVAGAGGTRRKTGIEPGNGMERTGGESGNGVPSPKR